MCFQLFLSVGNFTSFLITSKKNIAVARVHKVLLIQGPETDFRTQIQQKIYCGCPGGQTFSDLQTGNKLFFKDGLI